MRLRGMLLGILICVIIGLSITDFSPWSQTRADLFHRAGEQVVPSLAGQGRHLREIAQESHRIVSVSDPARHLTLGMTAGEVEEVLGAPERIDPSRYGYEWWVYPDELNYIQIGIREGKAVTIYTNAPAWRWQDWQVGQVKEEWTESWTGKEEVTFQHELGQFTFILSENDLRERALYIEGDLAVQLYIDQHDGQRVAGIRLMDMETLLLQRPYTVRYIGQLPDLPLLSQWEQRAVAAASEQQIFDLVNVTRAHLNLEPLQWEENLAAAARKHSEDMLEHRYFDHYSPRYGDLGTRLQQQGIPFLKAGENIAWNYMDAADVHHGWLNSLDHRKNVLEPGFTHLGVGVADAYYTQNFIRQPHD